MLSSVLVVGVLTGHLPPGGSASADSDHMVSLYADGQKRIFGSDAATVGAAIRRAGVRLATGDVVEPARSTALSGGFFNINVYRARPVVVVDGYRTYRFSSAYQSPRLIAQAAGLKLFPEDTFKIEPVSDIVSSVGLGDKVTVARAVPLTVKVDGKVRQIRTQAATVKAAVTGSGVEMGLEDTLSVPDAAPVAPQMAVSVSRVTEVVTDVTTVLPHTTTATNDPTVLKGQTTVKAEGADGQKVASYRIHYRDGVETGRDLLRVVSQIEPQPREVVVGTKVMFAGSVEYWRPMVVAAAAQYELDPNMMLRIMACESKGNATVVSKFVVNGQHPTGLFQYLPSTWRSAGGSDDDIFDGETQIKLTARKMSREGTSAWECQ